MSSLSNVTTDFNGTKMTCETVDTIFWNSMITLSFVFGFPGAFAVLLDMFRKTRKRTSFTPNDVFILNVTVMDGLYLLYLVVDMCVSIHKPNSVIIIFFTALHAFGFCGRPLFVACISLDCYLAVVHPVAYRARKSLMPRFLMAAGVWTMTAGYGYYYLTGYGRNIDFSLICCIILILPVVGFCNLSILWTLMRSSPGERTIHPQKKRALQIIINNSVITLISYLPIVITVLVAYIFLDEATTGCILIITMMCFTVVGITVSIILYLDNLRKPNWLKCWRQI